MPSFSKRLERLESFELEKIVKVARSKSILEQQEDFEEAVLVWLDTTLKHANQWTDEFDYIRELLNNVKPFHQFDECIQYLKTVTDDKVFLIVSHEFIHAICSIKSELRSITAIYVYINDKLSIKQQTQLKHWASQNEPLITGIYTNPNECFPQLTKDINDICDHDAIPVNYFHSKTKNLNNKETSAFLISYFFWKHLLFNLPTISPNQQQRIFHSALHYYRDNDQRINEIHHFQQYYKSELAIDWYFRTQYLSRALNKAIRTQNFTLIMNYRFVFHDIQRLIEQSRSEFSTSNEISRIIVYRAQNLNADELYRLRTNVNGLILINRYLQLCRSVEEAVNEVSLTSNTLETVLYHFSLDQSCLSISEGKVLLPVGSIFSIRYFTMEIDGIWHVHLDSISENDLEERIRSSIEELEDIPHSYLAIGLIWDKLKQTNRADRFYRLLIQNLSEQKDETALLCNYIGCICRFKCQFKSALTYHQRALGIYQHLNLLDSSFDSMIMSTYAQIALVYRDMGDVLSAISYFEVAMKFGMDEQISSHLAEMYRNREEYSLAQQYYQQTHLKNNIGLCYVYQRLFPEALIHLQHQTNSTCYINLGVYHQLRKEYDTALTYFNVALESVKDHPIDTAMIHSYLGLLHCDRRQWSLSLKHYEQALEMYKNLLLTQNHPTIALIHDGIGTLYLNKGEYRAAQHEFERCLELQTRVLPSQHPDIAGTYNNLGGVFNEMGSYEQALLYHYEALAIATATLPKDHVDIKLYEHNIAETKRKLS